MNPPAVPLKRAGGTWTKGERRIRHFTMVARFDPNLAHPPAATRNDFGENTPPPNSSVDPPAEPLKFECVCVASWTTAKHPSLLPTPHMTNYTHPHTGTTAECPHSGPDSVCCLWVYCCRGVLCTAIQLSLKLGALRLDRKTSCWKTVYPC